MANKAPLTVVIPHKNNSSTLSLAIRSCLFQSLPPSRIIVIDDNSSEKHLEKAQDVIDKIYSPVRIDMLQSPCKGVGSALNFGISLVSTPYVARMDSDDISLYWRFGHQLQMLKELDLDVLGSSAIATTSSLVPFKLLMMPSNPAGIKLRLVHYNAFVHPTILGKTKTFKLFPYSEKPNEQGAEDLLLWRTMVNNRVLMNNSRIPCLLYRLHKNQFSRIRRQNNLSYLKDSHNR